MMFAYWIYEISHFDSKNNECSFHGWPVEGDIKEVISDKVFVLKAGLKRDVNILIESAHNRKYRGFTWHVAFLNSSLLELVKPPFLISNMDKLKVLYDGRVNFTISDDYITFFPPTIKKKDFLDVVLPRRGKKEMVIPNMDMNNWIGVISVEDKGFFFKDFKWHLFAYTDRQIDKIEERKIYGFNFISKEKALIGEFIVLEEGGYHKKEPD